MNVNNYIILLQRSWQAFAGLIVSITIVLYMTPEDQGWYYSLISLAAIAALFDLGFSQILIQRSAAFHHEMSLTKQGVPLGKNPSKFTGLISYAFRWYRNISLLYVALFVPIGIFIFLQSDLDAAPIGWQFLLSSLILFSAINLWLLPSISVIEGSGDLIMVYGLRLAQGVMGTLLCIFILIMGGGVWASLAIPAVSALVGLFWLINYKPELLRLRLTIPYVDDAGLLWSQQWRLAINWLSGYFLSQIYVIILLVFDGPVAAGKFGLSLAIANMLAIISQSWLTSAFPAMSLSAVRCNWMPLRVVFKRSLITGGAVYVVGSLLMILALMTPLLTYFASRLLPLPIFISLLIATALNHFCGALSLYLRAFKLESLFWISFATSLITLFSAILVVGDYKVGGVVFVMLVVQVFFAVPLCSWHWYLRRKEIEISS